MVLNWGGEGGGCFPPQRHFDNANLFYCHLVARGQGYCSHPQMHRTTLHDEELSNVNSAKYEKLMRAGDKVEWDKGVTHSSGYLQSAVCLLFCS